MIIAVDLEFINRGYGHPLELISYGAAAEDGRVFYRQNAAFEASHADQWVIENVLAHLEHPDCEGRRGRPCSIECPWRPSAATIGFELCQFIGPKDSPEFWGDFCAFDYVLTSQMIGGFSDWPSNWPMYFKDIEWWRNYIGAPTTPPELEESDHHAGHDAAQILRKYRWLVGLVYGDATAAEGKKS